MYKKYIKRAMDFTLSLLAIICLSWLLVIIAILIRIKLGSPVIFKQPRPGENEKIFNMYKFRTMTDERDEDGNLLPDNIRLTTFGKLLRKTSLDELPELFCIIKGNMSIVGPRPQLVRDMVFMTEQERIRHTVRPGLTGLAQVSGRNNMSWEKKFEYDLEYIQRITFFGDIKIIFNTVFKVFKRDGIATDGMETAEDLGDYLLRVGKVERPDYDKKQEEAKELMRI